MTIWSKHVVKFTDEEGKLMKIYLGVVPICISNIMKSA